MHYKISEFAEVTGLSKETLRYYDDIGLLEPAYVDPNSHYRFYDDGSYFLATLLVKLRTFGCTIQEMKQIMDDQSFENLETLLLEKREEINKEIKQLTDKRDELDEFLKDGKDEG
ncbi:MerR family transcriptional regulator [Filobacillus milosensis]|uniref:MerR family transcriptional regulator n=1 Tax=Filobacillus milosensis TaxID=94137 RepID=A0A4Y8IKW9_9BACI|nr:MerR family transcriptional regulator [Filobacillus milosensis]TFB14229.1 MerR family transcriptional regulator [Filobacillus milosensis]